MNRHILQHLFIFYQFLFYFTITFTKKLINILINFILISITWLLYYYNQHHNHLYSPKKTPHSHQITIQTNMPILQPTKDHFHHQLIYINSQKNYPQLLFLPQKHQLSQHNSLQTQKLINQNQGKIKSPQYYTTNPKAPPPVNTDTL